MEPRRYYVIGSAMSELGPYTLEELGDALAAGTIAPANLVRTSMGTMLGTVAMVLRSRTAGDSRPPRAVLARPVQRSTTITLAAIGAILLLIVIMVLALHAGSPPKGPPPMAATVADVLPPAPARGGRDGPPLPGPSRGPAPIALGVHPGMAVATMLRAGIPLWALKATDQGGASHRALIANGEVAANVLDGDLSTKYYNFWDDDRHPSGIGTGLVAGLANAVAVSAFQFATANDEEGRDPIAIVIEGSNQAHAEDDGSSAFTLVYSGPSGLEADPGRMSWGPTVVFPTSAAFRTYRMLVTRKRDPAKFGLQYSEFRLGTPLPPP